MREIKFRAWNKTSTGMTTNHQTLELMSLGNTWEYPVMQYTGLKDKNGVEIYEGDIVKVDGVGLGMGIIEYNESYFRIFRPCVFSVNLCNYTSTNELEPRNIVEVIGNIHENKELLK